MVRMLETLFNYKMQKAFNLFGLKQKVDFKIEILAGLTLAMTMIPESLSFAILAGFPPLVGLYAAFIAGLKSDQSYFSVISGHNCSFRLGLFLWH
jgi:MFS superfamily sulfate permease-like transporter